SSGRIRHIPVSSRSGATSARRSARPPTMCSCSRSRTGFRDRLGRIDPAGQTSFVSRTTDMTRTKLVVTTLFVSCCIVMPDAQRLDPVRKVIDSYRVAIRLAQKDPSRGHLEVAFDAIGPLREAL